MQTQVEEFAEFVRSKPELAGGFNVMGLSQGNLILRAYISLYNDPPVFNFISIHGPHAGVASVPQCSPVPNTVLTEVCSLLDELIGSEVYTEEIQSHIAQSNYLRLPTQIVNYLAHCAFLPNILDKANENPTIRKNFSLLNSLALIMANEDTMLDPKETAWFGAYEDGGWDKVISVEELSFYESTGLKDLDKRNRVTRIKTAGNHLQFTQAELNSWIDRFFLGQAAKEVKAHV